MKSKLPKQDSSAQNVGDFLFKVLFITALIVLSAFTIYQTRHITTTIMALMGNQEEATKTVDTALKLINDLQAQSRQNQGALSVIGTVVMKEHEPTLKATIEEFNKRVEEANKAVDAPPPDTSDTSDPAGPAPDVSGTSDTSDDDSK